MERTGRGSDLRCLKGKRRTGRQNEADNR